MVSVLGLICAVGTRLLFGVHSVVVIWRTVDAVNSSTYWFLASGLVLLLIEMTIILAKRRGREWTWFCPNFFFYLLGTLPGIWLLEFDRLHHYRSSTNGTVHNDLVKLSKFQGFQIPLALSPDVWILVLEWSLLFLLIIGRWLLPKGDITHNQLSHLLLAYFGITYDIKEILKLLGEPEVLKERLLDYLILGAFSISLFQFTLILTDIPSLKKTGEAEEKETNEKVELDKSDPPNTILKAKKQKATEKEKSLKDESNCCQSEIWGIIMMVMMQDGPFLAIRLYVMVELKVINYTIIFFTFKNTLVLLLQFYRMLVVASHSGRRGRENLTDNRASNVMIKEHSKVSTATWASNRIHPSEGITPVMN